MHRLSLIAVFLFGAGCEQFKSPSRLTELEKKVDELSKEVTALKGSAPGAAAHLPGGEHPDKAGSDADKHGEAAGSGEEHGEHKAGDTKPSEEKPGDDHKPQGDKAAEHSDKPGKEAGKHGEKTAAKHGHDAPEKNDKADDKHGDAKADDKHGEAKADDKHGEAKTDDKHGEAKTDDKHGEAKHGDKADDKPADDKPPPDPSTPEGKKTKALADLAALINKTTGPKGREPSGPARWGYEGKGAPKFWGTLDPAWATCASGQAQSPIDIEPRGGKASPITFNYKPTDATIVDNGHTLQVNLAPGSAIAIDGQRYDLLQFHVHTPSEHTFAGEHYPLEVHLIHQDNDGRLAVVSVLYDAGAESKPLDAVWSKWPRKTSAPEKLRKPFDPTSLLPDTRTVYRYTGSLTTPPCTEGVNWNVMRRTLTDSKRHLDLLAKHFRNNARDIQPLNERKVQ